MQKKRREGAALRSPAAWIRFLAIIALGTAADLLSKAWAEGAVNPASPTRWSAERLLDFQRYFPGLEFIWQKNPGMVFGMGQGRITFLIIFTLGAIGLLTWLFADSRKRQYWLQSFLAMILAGALGNLYDRLKYEHVRDSLRFTIRADWPFWSGDTGYFWPYVFNVADIFISIGVVGLFVVWIGAMIHQRRRQTAEKAESK
ncbi:MAG: hypothetical protein GWP05_04220 [Anaerolineaceae bacterium]|nr:hypothetical protein [Anaerolineaceae bacterium]